MRGRNLLAESRVRQMLQERFARTINTTDSAPMKAVMQALATAFEDRMRFGYGAQAVERMTVQRAPMVYRFDAPDPAAQLDEADSGAPSFGAGAGYITGTLISPYNLNQANAVHIVDSRLSLVDYDGSITGGNVEDTIDLTASAQMALTYELSLEGTPRYRQLGTTFPSFHARNWHDFAELGNAGANPDIFPAEHTVDDFEPLPELIMFGVPGFDDTIYLRNLSVSHVDLAVSTKFLLVLSGYRIEFHQVDYFSEFVRLVTEKGFTR